MKKSYEDYVKVKDDVQVAYVKLFGDEKGRELIKALEEKKRKMYKDYDSKSKRR